MPAREVAAWAVDSQQLPSCCTGRGLSQEVCDSWQSAESPCVSAEPSTCPKRYRVQDIGTGSTASFSGQPRVGPVGHASGTCSRANFANLNTRRTRGGGLRRASVGALSSSFCSRVRRKITRSNSKNAAFQPASEAGCPLKARGASLPI